MNAALSFTAPWALFAFVLFIPLTVFWLFRYRTLKSRFRAAGLGPSPGRRYVYSGLFFGLFLACLVIALAGPRWGSRIVMEYRRGLDVVFALDLSRSMEIRDAPAAGKTPGAGTRLERGLGAARDAAAASAGVRFAAALGKGKGLLAVPLTGDTGTVLGFLEGLSGSSLTGGGTNLEALVDAAASAFAAPFPSRRLIVLVSDGEALSGSLKGALERALEEEIIVTALGVGSDEGAPVPGNGENAGENAAEGIVSRRQADVLRYAAERTGGIYIDGNGGDAAALLAEHFRSLAPESGVRSGRREPKPRWELFVIAAMLAFGASKLCMMKGRGKVLPLILAILFSSCSGVRGKLLVMEGNFFASRGLYTNAASSYLRALDHDEAAPYAEYGLGSVYVSLDEGGAALERYGASEKLLEDVPSGEHRELRYRLPYNAGLVLFGEGDYAGAAAAFRAALEIDSRRIDAKRNLELSLLSLAREQTGAGQGRKERGPEKAEAVLFDYLRRKERNQWRSREWIEEDTPGPDY